MTRFIRAPFVSRSLHLVLLFVLSTGLLGLCPAKVQAQQNANRPNIVFIMADDLGYGDVQSSHPDSSIPTPNINQLAQEGMSFTDAHTPVSVCTPTRYGLLTGRYPWRTRLKKGGVLSGYSAPLIKEDRRTISSLLGNHGYRTEIVGKWHLGLGWPTEEGVDVPRGRSRIDPDRIKWDKQLTDGPHRLFDYSYIIPASLNMSPFVYVENGWVVEEPAERQERKSFPDRINAGVRQPGFQMEEVLGHLSGKAVSFVHQAADNEKPFFLYFPLTAPHKPVSPAERFRGKTNLGPYGDFIHQVDLSVGRVMEAVRRAGVSEETLFIVTSDNGSFMYTRKNQRPYHVENHTKQAYRPEHHRANGPLRGTKADIWEAGHRVPFIVRWPGEVEPESVNHTPICLMDMLRTFAAIIDVEVSSGTGPDSFSILPLFRGQNDAFHRAPIIHQSHRGMFAVRKGKWKLVLGNGSGGRAKPAGTPFKRPYRLFDMSKDLDESNNLIEEYPDVAERLEQEVEEIRSSGSSW